MHQNPPRLPVPPASDRPAWDPARLDAVTLRDLRERGRRDLGSPWPALLARAYARYFRDGDRDDYEQLVFARQERLSRAAVLAAVTLDPLWIDEVADGVTLLCEQSSWCWPAHDDTFTRYGAVLPTVTDPYLDLGAGEIAAQLGWIDHLLGAALDERVPGLRARIRLECDWRVFTPFVTRRDWHWLGLDGDGHNWNPWIHGNVLVTAVSLVDDPDRRAALVALVVEGLDRYAASLPADGAVDEGYSYWWNGACRLLEALDLLDDRAGINALRETVAFPHRVHLGGEWYLNHADGPARPSPRQPWHALHRAARLVGDRAAEAHAAAHRRRDEPVAHESQGLGRLLRALTDPDWLTAGPGTSPLPRDVWFASTQVLLARPAAASSAGLTLAVKGGHNGEHHNHNDVGSVVVALGGVPVLVDPGRPTYTAQTFGPGRYAIWTMRSDWHNVPRIRGTRQSHGRQHAARHVSVAIADDASALTLDLAAAYPRTDVIGWQRTAALDRRTGVVTVRDAWELAPGDPDGPTLLHLVLAGRVESGAGWARVEALDDAGTVELRWEPASEPAGVTVHRLADPLLREVWGDRLTRLEIDLTALGPVGSLALNVKEQR